MARPSSWFECPGRAVGGEHVDGRRGTRRSRRSRSAAGAARPAPRSCGTRCRTGRCPAAASLMRSCTLRPRLASTTTRLPSAHQAPLSTPLADPAGSGGGARGRRRAPGRGGRARGRSRGRVGAVACGRRPRPPGCAGGWRPSGRGGDGGLLGAGGRHARDRSGPRWSASARRGRRGALDGGDELGELGLGRRLTRSASSQASVASSDRRAGSSATAAAGVGLPRWCRACDSSASAGRPALPQHVEHVGGGRIDLAGLGPLEGLGAAPLPGSPGVAVEVGLGVDAGVGARGRRAGGVDRVEVLEAATTSAGRLVGGSTCSAGSAPAAAWVDGGGPPDDSWRAAHGEGAPARTVAARPSVARWQ